MSTMMTLHTSAFHTHCLKVYHMSKFIAKTYFQPEIVVLSGKVHTCTCTWRLVNNVYTLIQVGYFLEDSIFLFYLYIEHIILE